MLCALKSWRIGNGTAPPTTLDAPARSRALSFSTIYSRIQHPTHCYIFALRFIIKLFYDYTLPTSCEVCINLISFVACVWCSSNAHAFHTDLSLLIGFLYGNLQKFFSSIFVASKNKKRHIFHFIRRRHTALWCFLMSFAIDRLHCESQIIYIFAQM